MLSENSVHFVMSLIPGHLKFPKNTVFFLPLATSHAACIIYFTILCIIHTLYLPYMHTFGKLFFIWYISVT